MEINRMVKCPMQRSPLQLVFIFIMAGLGAIGLYYLNLWVMVAYLFFYFVFFFVILEVKACKYCYYKKSDISLDQWKEEYLTLHTNCSKKWSSLIFIVWLWPIVGITIAFFQNRSIITLICLIGFICLLIVSNIHLRRSICPTCALNEICPTKQSRKRD